MDRSICPRNLFRCNNLIRLATRDTGAERATRPGVGRDSLVWNSDCARCDVLRYRGVLRAGDPPSDSIFIRRLELDHAVALADAYSFSSLFTSITP